MIPHSYPRYFSPDGCLTYEGLKAMDSGLQVDEVQQELAAHVKVCPLCAAAVEGLKLAGEVHFDEACKKLRLQLIHTRLNERTRPKNNAEMFNRFRIKLTPVMIKLAASVLILLAIGTAWLIATQQVNQFTRQQLASNSQRIDPLAYPEDAKPVLTAADFLLQDIIMLPPDPPQIVSYAGMRKPESIDYSEAEQQLRVVAEIMPEYIGAVSETGYETLNESSLLKLANLNGQVRLSFIVETDGSVSEIRVLRGLSPFHDQTAIAWIGEGGTWHPGIMQNQPCRMLVSCVVQFTQGIMEIKKC